MEDEPELTDDGENDAVTPVGSPLALSATDSEPPEVTAVETVAVAFDPPATLTFVGLTETEKSLGPSTPARTRRRRSACRARLGRRIRPLPVQR